MPISAPVPTADIGCALVKISASGPMPTSRYCDHAPCAISASFTRSASCEPGTHAREVVSDQRDDRRGAPPRPSPDRRAPAPRSRARACSTRTSRRAALIACRSQGARNQGSAVVALRRLPSWRARRRGAPSRGSATAARIAPAGSPSSKSALAVAATRDRSYTPSGATRTSAGPATSGSHTRPTSSARSPSSGKHAARVRRLRRDSTASRGGGWPKAIIGVSGNRRRPIIISSCPGRAHDAPPAAPMQGLNSGPDRDPRAWRD